MKQEYPIFEHDGGEKRDEHVRKYRQRLTAHVAHRATLDCTARSSMTEWVSGMQPLTFRMSS